MCYVEKTPYFELLAYRRIALSIVSACGFVDSRRSAQISGTPSGGAPILRLVTTANRAPAQAPRLPSQCSGFGSSL